MALKGSITGLLFISLQGTGGKRLVEKWWKCENKLTGSLSCLTLLNVNSADVTVCFLTFMPEEK